MQIGLSSRFLPTYKERTRTKIFVKDFFGLHPELFFLNHLTLLNFTKIEQIKEIKVILESFSLNRMCFGKLESVDIRVRSDTLLCKFSC